MTFNKLTVADPAAAALPLVEASIVGAVAERGRAVVALPGGSSPLPLFRLLAAADLPWDRLWVTFGDERFVPLNHEHSNAGAALAAWLDHVPIPRQQVLTWPILADPAESAYEYRRAVEAALGAFPTFDLNLLGLGDDGHTASLFPGTGAVLLAGPTLAVTAPDYAAPGGWRLSMSAARRLHARRAPGPRHHSAGPVDCHNRRQLLSQRACGLRPSGWRAPRTVT